MRILISEQCLYFLGSLLLGFCIALSYMPLVLLRAIFPHKAWLTAVGDFLFCVLSSILFLFLTYALSYGEIRWFGVFGTLSGALMFRLTLGRAIRRKLPKLCALADRFKRTVAQRLISPLKEAGKKRIMNYRRFCALRTDRRIKKHFIRLSRRGF